MTTVMTQQDSISALQSLNFNVPQNFPLVLDQTHATKIQQDVNSFDIEKTTLAEISVFGNGPEKELNKILDKFLEQIDSKEEPKIYGLVKRLGESMEKEKLDDLSDQIINPKIGLWGKIVSALSKKGAMRVANEALEQLRAVAGLKTKRISDVIHGMENELNAEMQRLSKEISKQEQIKNQYCDSFNQFALTTLYMHGCLEKAKNLLSEIEPNEPPGSSRLADLKDKIQAFESRTLAVEGALTQLPSDQLIIRQLQNAGIGTIQETNTTAATRFASIKKTLLTINGALMVQSLQQLNQLGMNLDNNLQAVQQKLMKNVVTTAANAPGINRLNQAEQIRAAVASTRELVEIVDNAKKANDAAFQQTTKMLADARKEMLELGSVVKPMEKLKN